MGQILSPGDYTVLAPQLGPPTSILPALQIAPFELLWGVGRSNPVQNPSIHGTATWTPGEPATLDYHPVKLPTDRDNLYCLRRLGQYIPDFSAATKLVESQVLQVSDLSSPEAIETDWHLQAPTVIGSKVLNPGLQLLPTGKAIWTVRLWDHIKGGWELASKCTLDGSVLLAGVLFGAEYYVSPAGLTYNAVTINGIRFAQTYSVPGKDAPPVKQQVFNKAIQVDANGAASPYQLKVGKMTITFA